MGIEKSSIDTWNDAKNDMEEINAGTAFVNPDGSMTDAWRQEMFRYGETPLDPMDASYRIWNEKAAAATALRKAIRTYAEIHYAEYTRIRGCSPQAAYRDAKDTLKKMTADATDDAVNAVLLADQDWYSRR